MATAAGPSRTTSGTGGTAASTGQSAPRWSRRAAFGVGGAGALALLLAGCGGSARLPARTVLLSEAGGGPLPTTGLAPQEGHLIELPGVRYQVRGVSLSESLPAQQAREAGLEIPDGEELEVVRAARGEQLLVVDLDRRPPSFLPTRPVPGTYLERVLLDGVEVARPGRSAPEVEGPRALQILISVPEDITPERIVLESSLDGITQRLSLLDGSRVSSDIEHVYAPRPDLEVAANWWQRTGSDPWTFLAGTVVAGTVAAVTPDGTWAAPGSLMVSLLVCTYPTGRPGTSTLGLVLPDGSTATPRGDHSRVFEAVEGGGEAWFEVPRETAGATARVELSAHGTVLATEEIAVTFTRE
ncbi:hypothetical protein CFK38_03715 [Brachybacterium vulturis]|uniref:Uncharacterized protein n=1 Tax=Brachybacterium vulturis TaxID=2017484 RepID=A0A291GKI9_9MICO|nr:hypothetical protein [Brachybacterium vulturis]ATG50725.1 hypothetical protein CFK38_03715 [Brachybacterium vulturis]